MKWVRAKAAGMDARRLRQLAIVGLALVAISIIVPSFHHVEAGMFVSYENGVADRDPYFRETFPSEWARAAIPVGIAGAVLTLAAIGWSALGGQGRTAARVGLVFAGILLIPLLVTVAGWIVDASSFELRAADSEPSYCLGVDEPTIHFWFRTSACPRWPEVVATALGVLAASLCVFGAVRASSRPALLAAAAGACALVTFVAWSFLAGFTLEIQFLLPGVGIGVLGASALALHGATREALNSEGA